MAGEALTAKAHPSGRDEEIQERVDRRMSGEIPDEDLPTLLKWYEANDFDDLLRLNRAFLRGESEFTLYHAGPIFVETTPMVPGLLRLHDYGMLTWQSQPWEIRDPFKCGCCMDRGWVQVEQISFISFLLPQSDDRIPKETLKAFLVELVTDEDIYVSIIKFENRFMYTCDGLDLRITSSFPKKWATHLDKCVSSHLQPGQTCHPV